jgi:hypothetical protein
VLLIGFLIIRSTQAGAELCQAQFKEGLAKPAASSYVGTSAVNCSAALLHLIWVLQLFWLGLQQYVDAAESYVSAAEAYMGTEAAYVGANKAYVGTAAAYVCAQRSSAGARPKLGK